MSWMLGLPGAREPEPVLWVRFSVHICATIFCVLALPVAATMNQTLETPPLRVERGAAVPLPDGRMFAASVAVYGAIPSREAFRDRELGCTVTDQEGRKTSAFLGGMSTQLEDRTVNRRVLSPLMTISRLQDDYVLRCSGPGVDAAAPVYVMSMSSAFIHPIVDRVAFTGALFLGLIFNVAAAAWSLNRARRASRSFDPRMGGHR